MNLILLEHHNWIKYVLLNRYKQIVYASRAQFDI